MDTMIRTTIKAKAGNPFTGLVQPAHEALPYDPEPEPFEPEPEPEEPQEKYRHPDDPAPEYYRAETYGLDGDELAEMLVTMIYRTTELLGLWREDLETENTGRIFTQDADHLGYFLHACASSMHCCMRLTPRVKDVWHSQIPEAVEIARFALRDRKGGRRCRVRPAPVADAHSRVRRSPSPFSVAVAAPTGARGVPNVSALTIVRGIARPVIPHCPRRSDPSPASRSSARSPSAHRARRRSVTTTTSPRCRSTMRPWPRSSPTTWAPKTCWPSPFASATVRTRSAFGR